MKTYLLIIFFALPHTIGVFKGEEVCSMKRTEFIRYHAERRNAPNPVRVACIRNSRPD